MRLPLPALIAAALVAASAAVVFVVPWDYATYAALPAAGAAAVECRCSVSINASELRGHADCACGLPGGPWPLALSCDCWRERQRLVTAGGEEVWVVTNAGGCICNSRYFELLPCAPVGPYPARHQLGLSCELRGTEWACVGELACCSSSPPGALLTCGPGEREYRVGIACRAPDGLLGAGPSWTLECTVAAYPVVGWVISAAPEAVARARCECLAGGSCRCGVELDGTPAVACPAFGCARCRFEVYEPCAAGGFSLLRHYCLAANVTGYAAPARPGQTVRVSCTR